MRKSIILAIIALPLLLLSCGEKSGSTISVSKVELSSSSLSLSVGESAVLTATVSPSGATDRTVSWSSSDASVASVSKGTVTGVSEGSATITAAAGGKTSSCLVTVKASSSSESTFAKGADVSWVTEMENDGKTFSDSKGNKDLFAVLSGLGMNAVRLRVWVEPTTGGWCTTDDVVKKAKRAAAAGLDVMIDFHYSSFFADPTTQDTPSAWSSMTLSELTSQVSSHTNEVLSAIKKAGVTPKWVQVGNETRQGMLWDKGKITWSGSTSSGWDSYAALSNAGYDAVKKVFPSAEVIVHLNHAYEDNEWWFTSFKNAGGKFDAIGLSHYPQTDNSSSSWTDLNKSAASNAKALASKFSCGIMICEVGVKLSDVSTGAKIMEDFMTRMKAVSACEGVFYWEPEVDGSWKPAIYTSKGWNAYDMGAFTSDGNDGKPTAILDCFAE